jgi:DNA-binding CsgD family transcriptional regulator
MILINKALRGEAMFADMRSLLRNKIKLICFFSIYSLIFYLPSMLIIGKGATIVGTDNTHWSVACNVLCMSIGFLSYPLSRKIFTSVKARKQAFLGLGVLLLLYILMFLGPLGTNSVVSYLLILGGEAFLMGYFSGFVFYYMAFTLQGSPYLGRIMGIALAIGVTLQNILQHHMLQVRETATITLAVTIIGMLIILWKAPHDLIFENSLPYEKKPPTFPGRGILAIFIVLLMSLLSGFIDCYLTFLNAHEVLDEADWPRLFFAVGLVLSGLLADIGRHRYLPLWTACASVTGLAASSLLISGLDYNVALWLNYFFAGFFVIYLMVYFLEMAPKTKYPDLWIVAGRVVYGTVDGLMVLSAPDLRTLLAGNKLLALSTLVVIGILVLCYLQGQLQIQLETNKEKVEKMPLSPLESFGLVCSFTPRENEVFALLLDDNLTIQDIADSLFISRRVCQRYLTSMYEKTQTKTRLNLLLKYYRTQTENSLSEEKNTKST